MGNIYDAAKISSHDQKEIPRTRNHWNKIVIKIVIFCRLACCSVTTDCVSYSVFGFQKFFTHWYGKALQLHMCSSIYSESFQYSL